MIRIKKENLNDTASFWASSVKNYLSEKFEDIHRLKYKNSAGVTRRFEDRFSKYKYIYEDKSRLIEGVSEETKLSMWEKIEEFLCDDKCLKGSEKLCKDWVEWQRVHLTDKDLRAIVKDIFISIYDGVSGMVAYDVLKNIGLRTCPYCNRHYTFTLYSKKNEFKSRPEFDHFYDKSTYPFLAVTFFNLIPSCKECNHGKGTKEVGVNPYFADFKSDFIIVKPHSEENARESEDTKEKKMNVNEIFSISKESDFSVDFEWHADLSSEDKEARNLNIRNLGLKQLYDMHKDYVMEIVEKASAYNALTREGIVDRFQGLFHSEGDVYNLIFGKYLSDAGQPKRPLSKLTADILHQLEIN